MKPGSKLRVTERTVGDVLVVDVAGSVVSGSEVAVLREEMARILSAPPRKVLLNLAGVSYMDSTGIGALLGIKTSAINRHVPLRVCGVPGFAVRVLEQLHLTRVLEVYNEERQALKDY